MSVDGLRSEFWLAIEKVGYALDIKPMMMMMMMMT